MEHHFHDLALEEDVVKIKNISDYFSSKLPGNWSNLKLKRFEGGQSNPTYLMQLGSNNYVLRTKPDGILLPSAHAIDREFKVMQGLGKCGLPVPLPMHYIDDESLIGKPFYIMSFIEGRIFKDPILPALSVKEREEIYKNMAITLAKLHQLSPVDADLQNIGKPTDFYSRQIKRWSEQYKLVEMQKDHCMDALIEWLPQSLPTDEESVVTHGDFRLENLIFHPTEPRILGILDWELATLGDYRADLAYNMMSWYLPQNAFGSFADRDISLSGIPDVNRYLEMYSSARNKDALKDWDYFVAFSLFRLASILYGVWRRGIEGNASSPDAIFRGKLAPVCAQSAFAAMTRHVNRMS